MHPKIVDSFWTDLDFERFEGAELAGHRLTFLWCVAGPVTNAAGILPLNRRAFTGDTGLAFDWLAKTMTAFPRAFTHEPATGHLLVRNYIRFQIGSGPSLATDNICAAVIKALRVSPPMLVREVLALYPDLTRHRSFARSNEGLTEALAKPLPSPSTGANVPLSPVEHGKPLPSPSGGLLEAPSKGKGKGKEEGEGSSNSKGDARGGASSEAVLPTEAEVVAWGEMDGVPADCCRDFWAYHEGRGWMSGQTRVVRPRNWLKSYFYGWQDRRSKKTGGNKPGPSGRLDSAGLSADDLQAALQTEADPQKRATLEKQLAHLNA